VFKNANLVRTANLDKGYARETINVIIENVDSKPQSEYYVPFESSLMAKVGGFEVRDKKDASKGAFKVEVVGYDSERYRRLPLYCFRPCTDLSPVAPPSSTSSTSRPLSSPSSNRRWPLPTRFYPRSSRFPRRSTKATSSTSSTRSALTPRPPMSPTTRRRRSSSRTPTCRTTRSCQLS
jgi:hypothetical protein